MKLHLRPEKAADFPAVAKVIEAAFSTDPHGDHTEHFLVERLRQSEAFIPELSIVAELNGQIVGHILLTKIKIRNDDHIFTSLSLAPLSVKPGFQKQGIGGKLILESHRIARKLGYSSIVVLGHENYYPLFGYELCSKYGIKLPFDAQEENCMVIALTQNGLKGVSGMVEYPKAFFESGTPR